MRRQREKLPEGPTEWQRWRRGPAVIYKGRGRGPAKHARCIACFPKSVAGQEIPLGRKVVITLCADHRDPVFLHSRGGRDFLAAVGAMFRSFGLPGSHRMEALRRFLDDVRQTGVPTPRHRPGSYAWPGMRRAAEQAWADGGTFEDGARAVYTLQEPVPAGMSLPSVATVRRWWREKRWFLPRPGPRPPRTLDPLDERTSMLHVRPPYAPPKELSAKPAVIEQAARPPTPRGEGPPQRCLPRGSRPAAA
jgi:hypothetical protein